MTPDGAALPTKALCLAANACSYMPYLHGPERADSMPACLRIDTHHLPGLVGPFKHSAATKACVRMTTPATPTDMIQANQLERFFIQHRDATCPAGGIKKRFSCLALIMLTCVAGMVMGTQLFIIAGCLMRCTSLTGSASLRKHSGVEVPGHACLNTACRNMHQVTVAGLMQARFPHWNSCTAMLSLGIRGVVAACRRIGVSMNPCTLHAEVAKHVMLAQGFQEPCHAQYKALQWADFQGAAVIASRGISRALMVCFELGACSVQPQCLSTVTLGGQVEVQLCAPTSMHVM